jgi:hypothetical protein
VYRRKNLMDSINSILKDSKGFEPNKIIRIKRIQINRIDNIPVIEEKFTQE